MGLEAVPGVISLKHVVTNDVFSFETVDKLYVRSARVKIIACLG